MNSSDSPSRIIKAFGVNGDKNSIPTDSSTTTDNSGIATFDKGFPPITMQPLSAGGIPPSGKDMNGVIYSVTLQLQWQNSGMTYQYNSDFSTAISGYPKGAVVPNSLYSGQWLNLNEANTNAPESSTGATTGWVPLSNYGVTSLSGLSASSITLSSIDASKSRLILTGTLTANINVVFPTWLKEWTVINNTAGAFSLVLKTISGSGVSVASGQVAKIYCDGVNILQDFGTAAQRDVGSSTNQIPDMGYFAKSLGLNGYQKLPGGLIIQWGGITPPSPGNSTRVTFPIPFTTLYSITTGLNATSAGPGNGLATTTDVSGSGFTWTMLPGVAFGSIARSTWIALGV